MIQLIVDLAVVFSELIQSPDLNIWEGLTHVGCSQEVYADALRLFCRDLEKKCRELEVFLKEENWKDYASVVHAIKGGLAGIGAWRLAEKAKILEDAVRKEDYQFCGEKSDRAINEIDRFVSYLKSSALFAEEKIEREKASPDFLEKKLGELYLFCSFGNSIEADSIARELRTRSYDGEIDSIVDTICTYVENLDYHLALQVLAEQPYITSST